MVSYTPVVAQAHTPPYKIHRYFARRPWNVFKQLVETFSKEDDVVLDPFCGGGVTIYEGIRLGRKVVGFDLNPLSIFIVRNMVKKGVNLLELDAAYSKIKEYLKYLYGEYNLVDFESAQKTLMKEQIEAAEAGVKLGRTGGITTNSECTVEWDSTSVTLEIPEDEP